MSNVERIKLVHDDAELRASKLADALGIHADDRERRVMIAIAFVVAMTEASIGALVGGFDIATRAADAPKVTSSGGDA